MQDDRYFQFLIIGAIAWFASYMLFFQKRFTIKRDAIDWIGRFYIFIVCCLIIGRWFLESNYLDMNNPDHVAISGVLDGMFFCELAILISFWILKRINQFQNREKV